MAFEHHQTWGKRIHGKKYHNLKEYIRKKNTVIIIGGKYMKRSQSAQQKNKQFFGKNAKIKSPNESTRKGKFPKKIEKKIKV